MVFVPKYGIEGPVHFDEGDAQQKANAEKYIYDEEKQKVASADGAIAYTVFDACAVDISVKEGSGNRRSLLLKLVNRALLSDAERVES